jgi:alternate signal-mediated exported protein
MNKLTKAAIASGVGVALLLGGAGTLASWNSSANIPGGTIVAGNLQVTDGGAGVWTVNGGTTPITIAGYKIVPGDTLTYTKPMSIVATGNNLVATLGIGAGSIAASSSGTAADVALAAYRTKSAAVTGTGPGVVGSTVTAGSAGVTQTVTAVVTIVFPKSSTVGDTTEAATKLGSVDLSGLTVSLTQN